MNINIVLSLLLVLLATFIGFVAFMVGGAL